MMPERENVFEASRRGGCPVEPENKDTQAKEGLERVIRDADSAYEEAAREQMDEDEVRDFTDEVADGAVEYRTYKAYMIWVQLGGYQYDSDTNGESIPANKPELIGAIQSDLYEWANRIISYRMDE